MAEQNVKITCNCNNGCSGDGDTSIHMDACFTGGNNANVLLRTLNYFENDDVK